MRPELMKQYKDSQICSIFACRMTMSKTSTSSIISKRIPTDVILEGLYKSKLQNSVQLQTVVALYDQEVARNNGRNTELSAIENCSETS